MAVTNTTYRFLVEKLGGTDPATFVGNEGEVFYDPDASSPTIRLSDGSTVGGRPVGIEIVEEEIVPITAETIEITALDTYGDGWNGGLVNAYVDDVLIVENFTIPDVGDNTETATIILPNVSGGSVIKIERVALGEYPEEMAISSVSIEGITLSSETHTFDDDGEIFLFTVPSSYVIAPTSYGQDGDARFNHYLNYVEYYDGNSWKPGVTGDIVVKNSTNIVTKFLTTGGDAGSHNVLLGTSAGKNITTGNIVGTFGQNNVLIGFEAGLNTTGSANNFIGKQAGYNTTSGSSNNFLGPSTGQNNTTGYGNTFISVLAGKDNTTGSYNFFVGYQCGGHTTTGSNNIAIGQYSGSKHTTGSHNTFLGSFTGYSSGYTANRSTASRKVIIGSGYDFNTYFDAPDDNKDTQLAIGVRDSTAASKYWLVGNENFNVGIGSTNPTSKLTVENGDIKVGTSPSNGLILTDSNGVAWRLSVNTDGTLATSAV